ncbi:MAG: hypothetical protein ABFC96_08040 [Thermoguttaceae bacterium]
MWSTLKEKLFAILAVAGCAFFLWHFWEVLCRLNGWDARGRPLGLLCLGLAVLLFAGGGIAIVVYRKYQRDMNRLFTADEREEFGRMMQTCRQASGTYGRKAGLLAGAVGVLGGCLYALCGQSPLLAFLPAAAVALIWLPFSIRRAVRDRRRMQESLDRLQAKAEKGTQASKVP